VLFANDQAFDSPGFWWNIRDGQIIGFAQTCATVVDATRFIGEFIVPPPFGPHASGDRAVAGEQLTTFIAPPYYGFAVTGSFVRVIDQAGDADPFEWLVPGTLTRGGAESSWRVYWQRGEVIDCATGCNGALAPAEAASRIAALRLGEAVCIVGWTDDVGNVEAERMYLNLDGQCARRD
jgi:hypothetical protein